MTFPDTSPVIDVDFRAQKVTAEAIASFLSREWREYLRLGAARGGGLQSRWSLPNSAFEGSVASQPAARPNGDGAGRTPQTLATDQLDRRRIERAVLNPAIGGELSGVTPRLAAAVAQATNDWLIAEWLDADSRFLGSLVVSAGAPKLAAAEVRRLGADDRIVQVAFAYPPCLLGNRFLHPIYDAANEFGLVISLETGGTFVGLNRGLTGVGYPTSQFEYRMGWLSGAQPHLVSMIAEGVFEKFPNIRLILNGFGIAWLPSLLWSMDMEYGTRRAELPASLARLPSEYVHEFIRFTSESVELPKELHDLASLLSLFHAERLILFGSGQSAGDRYDDENRWINSLPADWRSRVLYENAHDVYRLGVKRL